MHVCSQKLGRIRRMRAEPGLPNLATVHFLSTVNASLFKSYLLNVIFPKTKQNALLELTKNCTLSTKIIFKSHCSRKDLNVSVLLALLRIFCSLFKCNIHTDIINSKSYPLLLSLMITLIGAKNSITLERVMWQQPSLICPKLSIRWTQTYWSKSYKTYIFTTAKYAW